MNEIKILRLSLENFKCHQHMTLNFMGEHATVYGDNATGKTSIYDALTWLLFGKDSHGNGEKNIEIKPLDENGAVKDHRAQTSVEVLFLVNGEEMTLRRTLQEVWSTKRGSAEPTYDGNTSEYYVDGVPCKKNVFSAKVGELVSEDTFRLLTSVSYFASDLSWQERRSILFDVAGVADDRTILASSETFYPLIEQMGRLSIDDYKKKLLSEKRGLVGAKTETPARISECLKTIEDMEHLDFEGAKVELEHLNAKKEEISTKIFDVEHDTAAEKKRMEIREEQLAMTALENENRLFRQSQTSGAVNIDALEDEFAEIQRLLPTKRKSAEAVKRTIETIDGEILQTRNRWIATNKEVFTGGVCPTCGQALPAEQLRRATEDFEKRKKEKLADIEAIASSRKEERASAEVRLGEINATIAGLESKALQLSEQIGNARANVIEPKDMSDYEKRRAVITEKIERLSCELTYMQTDTFSVLALLRHDLRETTDKIKEINALLAKESVLAYTRSRIEELRASEKETAKRLDELERQLYLIEEFTRYKTKFVEDSINGMFRIAKFRLFREQANGGIEDRCDVVYDGVPYVNVNNGAKINLGIDIINTLSESFGVRVPLFVDNAESVTCIERADMQVIRLVVSEFDKELRVSYEG